MPLYCGNGRSACATWTADEHRRKRKSHRGTNETRWAAESRFPAGPVGQRPEVLHCRIDNSHAYSLVRTVTLQAIHELPEVIYRCTLPPGSSNGTRAFMSRWRPSG
jgi:hypothetical protein